MPPLRLLDRYLEDVIPEPPTLYDDLATRTHNAGDVNFFLTDYRPLRHYGRYDPQRDIYLKRMTDEERRAYHAVVDPQNEDYWRMRANGAFDDPRAMRAYHYQRFIKDYLRIVDALDENVGRLLDRIDADPALENTIVVYASDQGYFTGEHGYAEKRLMYEEAVRMPLLMRWPERIAPGTRIDAMVQNIDLAPTFLEVAGLAPLERMQGVPLDARPRGRDARRLAAVGVLPLLRPRPAPGRAARGRPHPDAQADPLLHRRHVGAVRPRGRSAGAPQRVRRRRATRRCSPTSRPSTCGCARCTAFRRRPSRRRSGSVLEGNWHRKA